MTSEDVCSALLVAILAIGVILAWREPPSPGNASGRGPGGESPR